MIRALVDKVKCLYAGRSGKWPAVRREHLKTEPACRVCGTKKKCEVHHLLPFHVFPEHELKLSNLWTLCRDHHLLFGHLMEWESLNQDCIADCEVWQKKIANRP